MMTGVAGLTLFAACATDDTEPTDVAPVTTTTSAAPTTTQPTDDHVWGFTTTITIEGPDAEGRYRVPGDHRAGSRSAHALLLSEAGEALYILNIGDDEREVGYSEVGGLLQDEGRDGPGHLLLPPDLPPGRYVVCFPEVNDICGWLDKPAR